jgi:hypothetical protein
MERHRDHRRDGLKNFHRNFSRAFARARGFFLSRQRNFAVFLLNIFAMRDYCAAAWAGFVQRFIGLLRVKYQKNAAMTMNQMNMDRPVRNRICF